MSALETKLGGNSYTLSAQADAAYEGTLPDDAVGRVGQVVTDSDDGIEGDVVMLSVSIFDSPADVAKTYRAESLSQPAAASSLPVTPPVPGSFCFEFSTTSAFICMEPDDNVLIACWGIMATVSSAGPYCAGLFATTRQDVADSYQGNTGEAP